MKESDPANVFHHPEIGGQCSSKLNIEDQIVADVALSPGQKALWFLQQLAPESPAYHVFRAVEIYDVLEIDIFRATMQTIADRHPVLRTTFTSRDGDPIQQIHKTLDVEFKVEDASSWSENQLDQSLEMDALRPFNLKKGSLFRVSVFCRSSRHYVVLFNFHHIITDLWSLAIMITEIGLIYDSLLNNESPLLSTIAMDYADYIRSQIELLSGEKGDRMWQYWKQNLSGELPILNLPTDRLRPQIQTYLGASQQLHLGEDLIQKLKDVARTYRISLFSMLIAAFQVLLYRYSGQEDIIVGTPKSCRKRKTMFTHGYFVNSVPLRVDCSCNLQFSEFMKNVHKTAQEASENEEYPFSLLVEQLKPERDTSRSPLFQAFFTMQKTTRMVDEDGMAYLAIGESGGNMNWGSLPVASRGLKRRISPFDLTMLVAETKKDFLVSLQYNIDLFNSDTTARMLGHYQQLLSSIVANPEEKITELEIIQDEERKLLFDLWNDNEKQFAHDRCIHELFEEQASKNQEAVALIFGERSLTYGELNRQANQLAHYLRKRGVGAETIVAISFERSIEMIVALMGVLKSGGAYLPIDPTYPADRLKFMVMDSGVQVLLTQQHLAEKFLDYNISTICLDKDWELIGQESEENFANQAMPENLAYMIYTSGSTGTPKGTMLTHRGVCNLAAELNRTFKIDKKDSILQFSSLSFDASVWEIFMAIVHGAQLVIVRQEQLISSQALIDVFKNYSISVVTVPPSVLAVIPETHLPDLRIIITAGEQCSPELVERWLIDRRFFNAYGPTETTVCASIMEVKDHCSHNPPIGRPIANFQLYILDAQLQPVPIGVVGELYIAGVGLSRGYFHEPCLTAEKFICNPFSNKPGQRMYRSGDLVRYLPDGNIEFLGRVDHQVKVRGFRIEVQEIELSFKKHPAVKSAIVSAKKDRSGDNRLVAYFSHDHQRVPDAEELRNFLKGTLPDYMVPSYFIPMESFPLTQSGKIDRKALPDPLELRSVTETAYVRPASELETLIASIWQEVLKLEKVCVHDNFFDIGGHSLSMAKVHSRLCEHTQRDISIIELFKYPTIHSLSQFLQQDQDKKPMFEQKQERASRQREALEAQRQRMRRVGVR